MRMTRHNKGVGEGAHLWRQPSNISRLAMAARAGEGGVEGQKIRQSDEDRWVAADSEDDRI